MNFKGCSNCKALGFIAEMNREETEEDDEETVTYTRMCVGYSLAQLTLDQPFYFVGTK